MASAGRESLADEDRGPTIRAGVVMETPIRYADRAVSLTDVSFLCEGLGSDAPAPRELARLLAEDEAYRARTLGDQRAFDAVLAHDEAFSTVSP